MFRFFRVRRMAVPGTLNNDLKTSTEDLIRALLLIRGILEPNQKLDP